MDSPCWQWIAAGRTYGVFQYLSKPFSAHRFSFLLANGYLPPMVLHKCDNKKCVNPDHLYAGDALANGADASARGLLPIGEANHKAKLTPNQVLEIKRRVASGQSLLSVSKDFPVSYQAVRQIIKGKAWKHVTL
jgi:response regulator of citrate/malate metabolism